jgi:hypothetical protein
MGVRAGLIKRLGSWSISALHFPLDHGSKTDVDKKKEI